MEVQKYLCRDLVNIVLDYVGSRENELKKRCTVYEMKYYHMTWTHNNPDASKWVEALYEAEMCDIMLGMKSLKIQDTLSKAIGRFVAFATGWKEREIYCNEWKSCIDK